VTTKIEGPLKSASFKSPNSGVEQKYRPSVLGRPRGGL